MELRSIDTAKPATIDLMALNNEIFNLRDTVMRSKAQVINKLTKNITSLKKKKGTDEQKQKNLQKAQRYFDEIKSIRSLKCVKIAKYSIANVSSFEEVSKATLSAGAKALARLADNRVMKEAVNKFREKHSDWRDLAAFMLIQQTGRRFKQRRKKKVKVAENINASKLMTSAYVEGLFKDDMFPNLEENSEEKTKKKTQRHINLWENVKVVGNATEKEQSCEHDGSENDDKETETGVIKEVSQSAGSVGGAKVTENQDKVNSVKPRWRSAISQREIKDETNKQGEVIPSDTSNDTTTKENVDKSVDAIGTETQIEEEEEESESESSEEENNDEEMSEEEEEEELKEQGRARQQDGTGSKSDTSGVGRFGEGKDSFAFASNDNDLSKETSEEEPVVKRNKNDNNQECVVKQLNIESENSDSDDEISSDSDDSDDEISSDSDDDVEEESESVQEAKDDKEEDNESSKRKLKKKGKMIPDFLTKSDDNNPRKLPRDPFFEGSDMEDEGDDNDDEEDDVIGDESPNEDHDINIDQLLHRKPTKSLFYKPGEQVDYYSSNRGRGRGRGRGRDGVSKRGEIRDEYQDRTSGGFNRRGGGGGGGFGGSRGGGFGGSQGSFKFGSHNKFDRKQQFGGAKSNNQSNQRLLARPTGTSTHSGEKLHPSWEASRKRKAEQTGIKAFAGTKITFNDD